MLFEKGIEIVGVEYTHLFADLVDWQVGGFQQLGRRFCAHTAQIVGKGKVGGRGENFSEIGRRQGDPFRQHAQGKLRVGVVLFHVSLGVQGGVQIAAFPFEQEFPMEIVEKGREDPAKVADVLAGIYFCKIFRQLRKRSGVLLKQQGEAVQHRHEDMAEIQLGGMKGNVLHGAESQVKFRGAGRKVAAADIFGQSMVNLIVILLVADGLTGLACGKYPAVLVRGMGIQGKPGLLVGDIDILPGIHHIADTDGGVELEFPKHGTDDRIQACAQLLTENRGIQAKQQREVVSSQPKKLAFPRGTCQLP